MDAVWHTCCFYRVSANTNAMRPMEGKNEIAFGGFCEGGHCYHRDFLIDDTGCGEERLSKRYAGRPDVTKAAVIIKDPEQQYEGLRTSIGLLLENIEVQMFVPHHEIVDMDDAYRDNMEFVDEMKGERYSNNSANVENYGFRHATLAEVARKICTADVIIPF